MARIAAFLIETHAFERDAEIHIDSFAGIYHNNSNNNNTMNNDINNNNNYNSNNINTNNINNNNSNNNNLYLYFVLRILIFFNANMYKLSRSKTRHLVKVKCLKKYKYNYIKVITVIHLLLETTVHIHK